MTILQHAESAPSGSHESECVPPWLVLDPWLLSYGMASGNDSIADWRWPISFKHRFVIPFPCPFTPLLIISLLLSTCVYSYFFFLILFHSYHRPSLDCVFSLLIATKGDALLLAAVIDAAESGLVARRSERNLGK